MGRNVFREGASQKAEGLGRNHLTKDPKAHREASGPGGEVYHLGRGMDLKPPTAKKTMSRLSLSTPPEKA